MLEDYYVRLPDICEHGLRKAAAGSNNLCVLLQTGQRGEAPAATCCLTDIHSTSEEEEIDMADLLGHRVFFYIGFIFLKQYETKQGQNKNILVIQGGA